MQQCASKDEQVRLVGVHSCCLTRREVAGACGSRSHTLLHRLAVWGTWGLAVPGMRLWNQTMSDTHARLPLSRLQAAASGQRTKKIFVGGLAATVDEEAFRAYFEEFGQVCGSRRPPPPPPLWLLDAAPARVLPPHVYAHPVAGPALAPPPPPPPPAPSCRWMTPL